MTLLKHTNKPSILLLTNRCTYNHFITTVNSFQNNARMNKTPRSIYFKTVIMRHIPPDIPINTPTSTYHNQFQSNQPTRRHPSRYDVLNLYCIAISVASLTYILTFRHRASSTQDRQFATLHRTLFIYLINKYISLSDICLTVHH